MLSSKLLSSKLRNFGITAHIDAGKTTTTERILFLTGAIRQAGNVDQGNTATDYLPEEKAHGITITAAAIQTRWQDFTLNIIDTPGHVDFTIEVERSLRVLDGAIAVLDASQGVEPQSETVWRQADHYGVPRIVFVNKMDKVGADFAMVLDDLRKKLGVLPLAVQWPIFDDECFVGVVDLLEMHCHGFDGQTLELPEAAHRARQSLIESLAELDEAILSLYVQGQPITAALLRSALRTLTLKRHVFPVLCGSALKDKGIAQLLDAVIDFLPSPEDVAKPSALSGHTLSVFAFKVISDQHGKLTFVRVYAGTLEPNQYLWNANLGIRERVNRLVKLQADQELEVECLQAGEIGAIRGLKQTLTGHTLTHSEQDAHLLEALHIPEPVVTVALETKTAGEQEKLLSALLRLTQEDPTLHLATDPESGQLTLSGMGELHLEVGLERITRETGLSIRTSPPQISYRFTLAKALTISHLLKKQTGGSGQYAQITIEASPLPQGSGFVFEDRIVGGALSKQFIASVRSGIEQAMAGCVQYPVTDVKVVLLDGKTHSEDSSDLAFQTAGFEAVQLAVSKAGTLLLEPLMQLRVTTPDGFTGSILGDLNRRRGSIENLLNQGNAQIIQASVPLGTMFGYANDLRSLSHGRASFSMQFGRYAVKP